MILALALRGGFEVGDTKPAVTKSAFVWRTTEVVEKAGDKTFTATGTKKGGEYLFRARGVCAWPSITLWTHLGPVRRQRIADIFGIDFQVTFGGGERQFMNVGSRRPELTELKFTADSDDVKIRIRDAWELPDKVFCTVDGIEVVDTPAGDDE